MLIATVVEGPTDRLVLEAVIRTLIPGDHRFLPLQPLETFGETGTGWKGVKRWCQQTWRQPGSSLETLLTAIQPPIDLLVIHVDADCAGERDLREGCETTIPAVVRPCPPAADTVERLIAVIRNWLQRDTLPPQVVFAIPAQDMENWTFAALFPRDPLSAQPDYECTKRGADCPCYHLTLRLYGQVLQRSGGHIKKSAVRYRDIAGRVRGGLGRRPPQL